jgi:hypothetical protein
MTLATLSLLRTLLELNCEDVMLDLVFKYLLPGTHVMVSQRREMRSLHARSASKILACVPSCCRRLGNKKSGYDDDGGGKDMGEKLHVYLGEARRNVRATSLACRCWRFKFDNRYIATSTSNFLS